MQSAVFAIHTKLHEACLTVKGKEDQITGRLYSVKLVKESYFFTRPTWNLRFALNVKFAEPSIFIPTVRFHKVTAHVWIWINAEQCSSLLNKTFCNSSTINQTLSNSSSDLTLFWLRFFVKTITHGLRNYFGRSCGSSERHNAEILPRATSYFRVFTHLLALKLTYLGLWLSPSWQFVVRFLNFNKDFLLYFCIKLLLQHLQIIKHSKYQRRSKK